MRMCRYVILLCLSLACAWAHAQVKEEGEYRLLCLLVAFEDQAFSETAPQEYFQALLNEDVKAYYSENSGGRFVPSFTVVGPLRLEKPCAYYGKNLYEGGIRTGDTAPEEMLIDALALLDAPQPESYDALYCIYAGYDESQGGPADALWAHQGFSETLGDYACSAEFSGASGARLTGIGPVCHELGHLLGLPDFYDTDDAVDGIAVGPGIYSLMGTGAHNQWGHRPPYLNALERYLLGWLEELPPLPEGKVELAPVQTNAAYYSPTDQEGEFFLYECRNAQGWDAGLPGGLLIYHVDRSDLERWEGWRLSNKLNANALHPCFYPVRSSAPQMSLRADASVVGGNLVFPGLAQNYCYEPIDWEEQTTGFQISNIHWKGNSVQFYVLCDNEPNLNGMVRDAAGKALQGAVLTLEGVDGYTLSDADGFFRFPLPGDGQRDRYTLLATLADSRPARVEVSLSGRKAVSVPVVLHKLGEAQDAVLSKFDRTAQFGYYPQAVIGAVRFSAADLASYVGQRLTEITFYPYLEPSFEGEIFVTVDIGETRVLTRKVDVPAVGMYYQNTVDVSDAGIVIPEGEQLYIGTGSLEAGQGFWLGTVYPVSEGSSFWTAFGGEASAWKPLYIEKAGFYMDAAISTTVREQADADLGAQGYAYIQDPGNGQYKAGTVFALQLGGAVPEEGDLSWWMDAAPLSGDSVRLPEEGTHHLEARIRYKEGKTEILRLKIKIDN